ncbi:MAG: response regulator [Chitinophagaceae bacterium]|nr:response regulator [Chitinophagaceae bacterium]MDB5224269.1 response regulator [Chitinophagaceae bacterium]
MNKNSNTANDVPSKFILLGEDDIDDQEILEEIFSTVDTSLNLQFFNNGRKVISHLENAADNLPCLIVLDFNMPELNGAEILKMLKEDRRLHPIPKIIWSTSDSPVYKAMCMELGACDYLVKPSTINELENMVKHMLTYCAS